MKQHEKQEIMYEPWTPSPWAGVTGGLTAVVGTPLTMHFVARSAEKSAELAHSNAAEVLAQEGVGDALSHALDWWNLLANRVGLFHRMTDGTNVLHFFDNVGASVAQFGLAGAVTFTEFMDTDHGEYRAQPTPLPEQIFRTVHIPLAATSVVMSRGVIENLPQIAHNIAQAIKLGEVPAPELASLGVLLYGAFSLWRAGRRIAAFIKYPTEQMRAKQKKILTDFRKAVSEDLPKDVRLRVDNAAKVKAMAYRANFIRRLEDGVLKNARRGARIVVVTDRTREANLKKPSRPPLLSTLEPRTPTEAADDSNDIPPFLRKVK